MKTLKLKFYSDPGHGWLACKVDLLVKLGINKTISRCSYVKGGTAYLEEDCDAERLINALKAAKIEYTIESKDTNRYSPIRNYQSWNSNSEPAPQTAINLPAVAIS